MPPRTAPYKAQRRGQMHEMTFPGTAGQLQRVRAAVRCLLGNCPVAADAVLLISELAANACQHSDSRLPGGHFAIRLQDFPGEYIYADVRDQGSDWDADLDAASICPHGLYMLRQLAATRGTAGGRRGRTIWFTITYPASQLAQERKAS